MKTYHLLPGDSVGSMESIRPDDCIFPDVPNLVASKNLFVSIVRFKKMLIVCVGILTGAITGYVYWRYVGYDEQTPWISSVWISVAFSSGLLGLLFAILSSPRQIET